MNDIECETAVKRLEFEQHQKLQEIETKIKKSENEKKTIEKMNTIIEADNSINESEVPLQSNAACDTSAPLHQQDKAVAKLL